MCTAPHERDAAHTEVLDTGSVLFSSAELPFVFYGSVRTLVQYNAAYKHTGHGA